MDYEFYADANYDIFRTNADDYTELSGNQVITQALADRIQTDSFHIDGLIKTERLNGRISKFYAISRHLRETDYTPPVKDRMTQLEANQDYLSMMTGVDLMTEEVAPDAQP